jgi:hypothetical protein
MIAIGQEPGEGIRPVVPLQPNIGNPTCFGEGFGEWKRATGRAIDRR